MPVTTLDARTALVLIDLQKGITSYQTAHPVEPVLANATKLVEAFRARELPVVRVRVAFSPDGADALRPRTDAPPSSAKRGADFSDLDPRVPLRDDDLVITKRQWGAFYGTELDLQLRRRNITGIVLCGIATSIGVESTARQAYELGYQLAIASDAVTDMVRSAHDNSLTVIFPRIGQVDTTAVIVAATSVK